MIDSFVVMAALGGMGVALAAGPLGCFVVWRRMAFFGDALAHAGLLGLALALWLSVHPLLGVLSIALIIVLVLGLNSQETGRLGDDTMLGIVAHGSLALGLLVISLSPAGTIDLHAWLFGDILALSQTDLAVVAGTGVVALAGLLALWRPLVTMTLSESLAKAEGLDPKLLRLGLLLCLALCVAAGLRVVGVLLMTSLLILPAASARWLASTPARMAALAALLGCSAVILGLVGSLAADLPAGPAIVTAALMQFVLVRLARWRAA